jgi:hypothetical protein
MNFFKLSSSLVVASTFATTPEQVHIALAGEDGMRITWFTAEDSVNPYCLYGASPDSLSDKSSGNVDLAFFLLICVHNFLSSWDYHIPRGSWIASHCYDLKLKERYQVFLSVRRRFVNE